ncbi:hypothetical protein [Vibrio coralliilyticus]|uniref:hypothetical protein n=1 Tax=Vibrio coralliilyticus TaxID=190893 RepID=UPI0015604F57|nr:hypothetical protein [Vibrio coralliilyticus]NRF53396.1 hypothetical protein [Vibrio coralliilyticus]NRG05718.1 hypothetical protein [Vibrio coralliilyticus]
MSQNYQALTVQLNAWLWKPKKTITLTAPLLRFAITQHNKPICSNQIKPKDET